MKTSLSNLRSLLDKCTKNNTLQITQIHAQAITQNLFNTHQVLACKLLNFYAKKLKTPTQACKIFNQIQSPDIISWSSIMSLYLNTQQPMKTLSVFSDMMMAMQLKPDGHCTVAAISACGHAKNMDLGKVVHGMVLRYELDGVIVWNALVDMYARNGRVEMSRKVFEFMGVKDVASWTSLVNGYIMNGDIMAARCVFDEMPERNVISWTAMIVGYVRSKNVVDGLELFRKMRKKDFPTCVTIVAVLSGCADVGAVYFGRVLHGYVVKVASLVSDVSVNNALIDMYGKGGSVELARKVFEEMKQKDVYSWTSLISGLALHGEGRSTVDVFNDMVSSGLIPNEVTFLAVLSACGHGGLIDEGISLFDKMVHRYGIKPTIKHYGCVVDLYCRAGDVDEAMKLIIRMPMEPDAVIWRSILSACILKRDKQLAEIAAKKVLELEPNDDGVYILLWNFYRLTDKWEDALKTRKLMRTQNIRKTPGCSWIEINGFVHEFTAENKTYQLATDMQTILEVLADQSKSINDHFIL